MLSRQLQHAWHWSITQIVEHSLAASHDGFANSYWNVWRCGRGDTHATAQEVRLKGIRRAPQDGEFRLRSACSHRATSVRTRPCNPTIARVRAAAVTQDLSGTRVLRDGSIVVIEQRHAEAQQQLVDGGLVLPDGAIELAFPLLIGVPHAHGNAIGEARTGRLLDQWHDGCR